MPPLFPTTTLSPPTGPPAPGAEGPARRLRPRPRTPPLTPAQAEALSIVAYLQPVSRPEMARIRGVASDSAVGTLLERGDRKSTRLNSSHANISYAVFCLKKKKQH